VEHEGALTILDVAVAINVRRCLTRDDQVFPSLRVKQLVHYCGDTWSKTLSLRKVEDLSSVEAAPSIVCSGESAQRSEEYCQLVSMIEEDEKGLPTDRLLGEDLRPKSNVAASIFSGTTPEYKDSDPVEREGKAVR